MGLTVQSLLGTDTTTDLITSTVLARLKLKDLERLGIDGGETDPNAFIFKKISDNGSNIKCAWDDDESWAPCVDHTIELCTLPFTYVQDV